MKGKLICILVMTLLIAFTTNQVIASKNNSIKFSNIDLNNDLIYKGNTGTTIYVEGNGNINSVNASMTGIITKDNDDFNFCGYPLWTKTAKNPFLELEIIDWLKCYINKDPLAGAINIDDVIDGNFEGVLKADYEFKTTEGQIIRSATYDVDLAFTQSGENTFNADFNLIYSGDCPPCPTLSLDQWEDYIKEITKSIVLRPYGEEGGHIEAVYTYELEFKDTTPSGILYISVERDYYYDSNKELPFEEIVYQEITDVNLDDDEFCYTSNFRLEPALKVVSFSGGFGCSALIENLGTMEAEEIMIKIDIDADFMIVNQENFDIIYIEPKEYGKIRSGFIFGFGDAIISATIFNGPDPQPADLIGTWKTTATVLGPFVLNLDPDPQPA